MFREQVSAVSEWFDSWDECEQIVVLYSMLRKLHSGTQARFLSAILEQLTADNPALPLLEQQANNPAYIGRLCQDSQENALAQLVLHLPLLRPGNEEAVSQYLGLLPSLFSQAVETGMGIEESRQLLAYSLIHPAIASEDRRMLATWLTQIEQYLLQQQQQIQACQQFQNGTINEAQSPATSNEAILQQLKQRYDAFSMPAMDKGNSHNSNISPASAGRTQQQQLNSHWFNQGYSDQGSGDDSSRLQGMRFSNQMANNAINSPKLNPVSSHANIGMSGNLSLRTDGMSQIINEQNRLRRSNSLTPPVAHHSPPVDDIRFSTRTGLLLGSGVGEGCKQRSLSLSSTENAPPLSPQNSLASSGSGSESHLADESYNISNSSFNLEGSGMRDVPAWLKSLRLHKYAYLFAQMTYEDMMTLSEDKLETQSVTKGARHKIVLSVHKLRERQNALRSLEKDIVEGGSVRSALAELKSMLMTPIKPFTTSRPPDEHLVQESGEIALGDLPSQFTRVVGKICTQLLVSTKSEDDCFSLFLLLVDRCLHHEAFTLVQKKRLLSWKQQIQKIWHPLPRKRSLDARSKGRWCNQYSFSTHSDLALLAAAAANSGNAQLQQTLASTGAAAAQAAANYLSARRRLSLQQQLFQQQQCQLPLQQQQQSALSQAFQNALAAGLTPLQQAMLQQQNLVAAAANLCNVAAAKRSSLPEQLMMFQKPHLGLQRTKSAPVRPILNPGAQMPYGQCPPSAGGSPNPMDTVTHCQMSRQSFSDQSCEQDSLTTRLESLCLSVTEHALGSSIPNINRVSF